MGEPLMPARIADELNAICDFLEAFETAYDEVGADRIECRDAETIEKIIDDFPLVVSALQRMRFEYTQKDIATDINGKIKKVLQSVVERVDGGLAMLCIGSGAEQFRSLIRNFLEKEVLRLTEGISIFIRKLTKPRYGTDYLAMSRIRSVVSSTTIVLKNNPKSGLVRKLTDSGVIAYRRDRDPEFPAVDTGWDKKGKTLNFCISRLYNAKTESKEER